MADAADPGDEENRSGGWYELAVELDTADEVRVAAVHDELDRLAGVERVEGGCVLRLPAGPRVVCTGATVVDDGTSWVVLGLPMGALVRADPRVGGSPFGDDPGTAWRRPLDAWLVSLALRLFDVHPFLLALVGHDVSGDVTSAQLAAEHADGRPVERHRVGIVVVRDGVPSYRPATG